jgi:hypothetical protein
MENRPSFTGPTQQVTTTPSRDHGPQQLPRIGGGMPGSMLAAGMRPPRIGHLVRMPG